MNPVQFFGIFIVGFILYLGLKRNPQWLDHADKVVDDIHKDGTVLAGKPLRSYVEGPSFLMMNNRWLFAPPIGSVITKPTGTDPGRSQKQPVIIGLPRF